MSLSKEPIIKIQDLTKEYYNKVVIDNVNLEIYDSCFAFLGPNGAGKTTIMLMLLGLVKPSNGTAYNSIEKRRRYHCNYFEPYRAILFLK